MPIRSSGLTCVLLAACSAQAPVENDDLEREEAARLEEKEGRASGSELPAERGNGVWDCTKTVFTDFFYLPANVARGMNEDVTTYSEQRSAAQQQGDEKAGDETAEDTE